LTAVVLGCGEVLARLLVMQAVASRVSRLSYVPWGATETRR